MSGIMQRLFGNIGQQTQGATVVTGAAPAPATTQQQVATEGGIPQGGGAADNKNPHIPAGSPASTDPNNMDEFKDLWNPPVDANGKPVQQANGAIFPNVDPKKIMEVAGKANFASALTPELRAKIQAGGAEANDALIQAMNTVAQTVYAQSALANTKLIEQALQRQAAQFETQLPSIIKRHAVQDNLRTSNPLFNDPAVAPIITALEAQFATKYPNATATELTNMAQQYVTKFGNRFSTQQQSNTKPANESQGEDWDRFL